MTSLVSRLSGLAEFAGRAASGVASAASGAATTAAQSAATSAATQATTATGAPSIPKVAKQFEAVFLRQMIGSMRQASLSDGLFDSSAGDQFRDMADAKVADSMAGVNGVGGGGFGIAELLARQLAAGGAGKAP